MGRKDGGGRADIASVVERYNCGLVGVLVDV